MKNCAKKLKDIIENVVLPDVEDYLDDIFSQIASAKNATDENTAIAEKYSFPTNNTFGSFLKNT